MNVAIDDARQLLESLLPPAKDRVANAATEMKDATDELDRIEASLAALNGTPDKDKSKLDRRNIDANMLVQLFEQFLSDNGPLAIADLDGLVRSKAKELGYALGAYGQCKKKALKNPQFGTDSQGRVTLRQPSDGLNVA